MVSPEVKSELRRAAIVALEVTSFVLDVLIIYFCVDSLRRHAKSR